MIAVVNVSKIYAKEGEQTYLLKINNKDLLQFKHNAEDGLVTCLRKAANAYKKEKCCDKRNV